jgi:phage/plasmid primase-like uncharacterized protein
MLGQDTGIPHDPEQHTAYVESWIKALEKDPHEIQRACRDAEQIKEYILGLERSKELGQDKPLPPDREESIAAKSLPKSPAPEKTFLSVPYKEKDQAKKLGAKWDREAKSWYAPEGAELSALQPWLPVENRKERDAPKVSEVPETFKAPEPPRNLSPQDEFARALHNAGLDLQGKLPVFDGEIHHVPLLGSKGGPDGPGNSNEQVGPGGMYCAHDGKQPYGWMQNFESGEKTSWFATWHVLSAEQIEAKLQKQEELRQERDARIVEYQNEMAREAVKTLLKTEIPSEDHPYLKSRKIGIFSARQTGDTLYISMRNADDKLRNLHIIEGNHHSRFMGGAEREGLFHLIARGDQRKELARGEIILTENYAAGASLHMATDKPVAVAFTLDNLTPVAKALRKQFPKAAITICASNNQYERMNGTVHNQGVIEAKRAAEAIGGKIVVPEFNKKEQNRRLVDFNELHLSRGLDEVKRQFDSQVLEKVQENEVSKKAKAKGKEKERGLSL